MYHCAWQQQGGNFLKCFPAQSQPPVSFPSTVAQLLPPLECLAHHIQDRCLDSPHVAPSTPPIPAICWSFNHQILGRIASYASYYTGSLAAILSPVSSRVVILLSSGCSHRHFAPHCARRPGFPLWHHFHISSCTGVSFTDVVHECREYVLVEPITPASASLLLSILHSS